MLYTSSGVASKYDARDATDHKFDPIPQVDYYRMAAAFWGGTIDPGDRSEMGGPNDKQLGFKKVFGWTDVHKNPPQYTALINGDPDRKIVYRPARTANSGKTPKVVQQRIPPKIPRHHGEDA